MAYTPTSVTDVWDDLFTMTARKLRPQIYDQIFGKLPLLWYLEKQGRKRTEDGGHSIGVPLMYGFNPTTAPFARFDVADTTPSEGHTMAFYEWSNIWASITLCGEDLRKNSGVSQRFNLLKQEIHRAQLSMRRYMNNMLHGLHGSLTFTFVGRESGQTVDSQGGSAVDNPTNFGDLAFKAINSVDNIIRSGWGLCNNDSTAIQTHITGKITASITLSAAGGSYNDWDGLTLGAYNNPWWLNYSNPGFLRLQDGAVGGVIPGTIPIAEMDAAAAIEGNAYANVGTCFRSMFNRLTGDGEDIDLLLGGVGPFEAYEASLVPNERYTDLKIGDSGFQNLAYKTVPFIFDHGITTQLRGTPTAATHLMSPVYFINSGSLEWVVHRAADFAITPFRQPPNQDAKPAQILLMGQLCCNNRSRNGVISCGLNADYTPA